MKPPRPAAAVVLLALAALSLAAGCTNSEGRSSLGGAVDGTAATTPTTELSTTTTQLGASELVLEPDGLGPVRFGTQAAVALADLTGALGQADKPTTVPAGSACGATRMFRWRNLGVLVNEVSTNSDGLRGLVGWSLEGGATSGLEIKTAKGIGIGSMLQAVRTAYAGGLDIVQSDPVPVFTVKSTDGMITGELDGLGATSHVRSLRAGRFCGV